MTGGDDDGDGGDDGPLQNGAWGANASNNAISMAEPDYAPAQVNCSGQITAAFTWQPAYPGEPTPQCAILTQTSSASSGSTGDDSGQMDDGLGDSDSVSTISGGGEAVGRTTYSSQSSPGTPAQCDPSASGYALRGTVIASVSYAASLSPVTINLGSTTSDGSGGYAILVGQGCTASIQGIPAALLNNTANPPVYAWSVTGTTFQKWAVSSDQSNATLTSGSGPLNQATAHWYWNEAAATETITCTVTLTPPAGQGNSFPVTVTQQVSVVDPSFTCSQHAGEIFTDSSANQAKNGLGLLTGGVTSTYPNGDEWTCKVQTPSLFGSGGSCDFVQEITAGRSKTYPTGTVNWTENGQTGLDTIDPSFTEAQDPYTMGSGLNAGWPADNSQHQDGDSPDTPLGNPATGQICTGVTITESFYTFLTYLPPGNDVQRVPLHLLTWNWHITVQEPASGWGSPDGVNYGPVTATTSQATHAHPQWTQVITATTGTGF